MKCIVFVEHRDGQVRTPSLEACNEASRLSGGGDVVAIALGPGAGGVAEKVGPYGATKLVHCEDEQLATYSGQGFAHAVAEIVKAENPDVVLVAATAMGKDFAPRVAVKVGAGIASDCTALSYEGNVLKAKRPAYAGKAVYTVAITSKPSMATLRPKAFSLSEPDSSKSAAAEPFEVAWGNLDIQARVTELQAAAGGKVDLTEADIIVSGGRALKGPENFGILEELADQLGGVIGASRAVVDAGWRPHADQVGQTGKTVSPTLYIAAGISGAIQHLAGMTTSKCIVAVNKDPEAPIFKVADYGIVGDLFEIIPEMTKQIKELA